MYLNRDVDRALPRAGQSLVSAILEGDFEHQVGKRQSINWTFKCLAKQFSVK